MLRFRFVLVCVLGIVSFRSCLGMDRKNANRSNCVSVTHGSVLISDYNSHSFAEWLLTLTRNGSFNSHAVAIDRNRWFMFMEPQYYGLGV